MTAAQPAGALLGRVLLAIIFLLAGFAKLGGLSGAMAYTASGGLPGFFIFPAIAIEILGGLFVIAGYQTRWAALALALFCVMSGYFFHYVPSQGLEGQEQMNQMNNFLKNLALAGGFLVLAAQGPGLWSVDARLDRSRVGARPLAS